MSRKSLDALVGVDLRWEQMLATHSDPEAVEQDRSRTKVLEIDLVKRKLGTSTSGNLRIAADLVAKAGKRAMDDETFKEFERRTNRAARLSKVAEHLDELQESYSARVVNEPRVYAEDSPNSYFRDLAVLADPAGYPATMSAPTGDIVRSREAGQRLARYGVELSYELRSGSPEGKRAMRSIREQYRVADADQHERIVERYEREIRALGTGGGTTASATGGGAAAFVSPFFLTEAFAPYRGIHRSFADWCGKADLPAYGMQGYLPAMTGPAAVAQYTELAGVTETDPSMGLRGSGVVTIAGQITLSNAVYDRAYKVGGAGGGFDVALNRQLQQQLDQNTDAYAIAQALAGTTAITGASTWTNAGTLYTDIALGREQLTDTAGTRLRPTTFFSTSDFYSYVTRQVDTAGRPIVSPQFAPALPIQEAGDSPEKWSRFTGTILPGSVLWIEDDNIPASSGKCQLLVSAPDEAMVLAEGEPILSVFLQTDAVNLETIVSLRKYTVAIARYPAGTATIVGAAYPTTLI